MYDRKMASMALDERINALTDDDSLDQLRQIFGGVRVEPDAGTTYGVKLTITNGGGREYRGSENDVARFIDGYVACFLDENSAGRGWPQADNE